MTENPDIFQYLVSPATLTLLSSVYWYVQAYTLNYVYFKTNLSYANDKFSQENKLSCLDILEHVLLASLKVLQSTL